MSTRYKYLVSPFAIAGYAIVGSLAFGAITLTPFTEVRQRLLGVLMISLSIVLTFFLFIAFTRSHPKIIPENKRLITWVLMVIILAILAIDSLIYFAMRT